MIAEVVTELEEVTEETPEASRRTRKLAQSQMTKGSYCTKDSLRRECSNCLYWINPINTKLTPEEFISRKRNNYVI